MPEREIKPEWSIDNWEAMVVLNRAVTELLLRRWYLNKGKKR